MPRAVVEIQATCTPLEALDYLADFSRAPEWDPSVVTARRLDDGPVQRGSRFELTVRAAGRTTPLVYELVARESDSIVLLSRSNRLESRDTITVAPTSVGARVRYEAELRGLGWSRVANPLLAIVFRRLAGRAAEGLRRQLNAISGAN